MNIILQKDSKRRYFSLTQKKNFCGPACIQMILLRHGHLVDQEKIAFDLESTVLCKDKNNYVLDFDCVEDDAGVYFHVFDSDIGKNLLKNFNLQSKFHKVSQIDDFEMFIENNLKEDNDLIACVHEGIIFNKNSGHYVLIDNYNSSTKTVTICDPGSSRKSYLDVSLLDLKKSMLKEEGHSERGIAKISKLKN